MGTFCRTLSQFVIIFSTIHCYSRVLRLWWFNSFVNPFLINILTCSMTLSSQRLFLSLSSASVLITSGRSALFLSLQQLFSTLCFSNFYRSELVLIRSSNNSSSGRWRIALYYRKKKNSDGFKTKIHLLLWNVKTNIDDELYISLWKFWQVCGWKIDGLDHFRCSSPYISALDQVINQLFERPTVIANIIGLKLKV